MAKQEGQLRSAQKTWEEAEAGSNAPDDQLMQQGYRDRSGDPAKSAQRGSVSQVLNADAAKYRKGSSLS